VTANLTNFIVAAASPAGLSNPRVFGARERGDDVTANLPIRIHPAVTCGDVDSPHRRRAHQGRDDVTVTANLLIILITAAVSLAELSNPRVFGALAKGATT
jgi:hypothetical protein